MFHMLQEKSINLRVFEKVGFKKEGIIRKRFFIQGRRNDQVLYSILKEEWKEPKLIK